MSAAILKNLQAVPDLVGSVLLTPSRILSRDLPDLLRDEKLMQLGKLFSATRQLGSKASLDFTMVEFDLDGAMVCSYGVAGTRQLLVVALPTVNRGFLDLSVRMVLDELKSAPDGPPDPEPSESVPELPAAILDEIARELAVLIGPAAKVVVKRCHKAWLSQGAPDKTRLLQFIAAEIDVPEDRARFRTAVSRLL